MVGSYEEFKTAVYTSLRAKVADRLDTEREAISNNLFRPRDGETPEENTEETQSNEVQN